MKASTCAKPTCEKDFILNAIGSGIRFDGRQPYDYRKLKIAFGVNFGHCDVSLGNTRVLSQVSCEIIKPSKSRPTEGQLFLNIELSPMASPEFEIGRPTDFSVLLNRLIERCLRESRPVDMESLCIIAGEKVWSLRVDIHVLDDGGNILDCSCIAAMAALSHFRRPEVTVVGEEVTVHSPKDRDPIPLNVHHKPICVTFGFINNSDKPLVDPTRKEENVLDGQIIMAMNSLGEICCAQMSGGVSVGLEQIMLCCKIASVKVSEITEKIKSALAEDLEKRFPPKVKWKDEVTIKPVLEGIPAMPITQTTEKSIEMDLTEAVEEAVQAAEDMVEERAADKSEDNSVSLEGPGTGSIGGGGENSWIIIEDESSDDDVVEITKIKPPREEYVRPLIRKSDWPIIVNDDSEEEDTVIITSGDIGFNHDDCVGIKPIGSLDAEIEARQLYPGYAAIHPQFSKSDNIPKDGTSETSPQHIENNTGPQPTESGTDPQHPENGTIADQPDNSTGAKQPVKGTSTSPENNTSPKDDKRETLNGNIDSTEIDMEPDTEEKIKIIDVSTEEIDVSKKAIEPEVSESIIEPDVSKSAIEPDVSKSAIEPDVSKKATEPEVSESTVEPEASESTVEPEASESTVEPEASDMNIEPEEPSPKNKKKTRAKKKKATEPEASESTVGPEASESTVEPEASESTVEPEASDMNIEPEESTPKNKKKTRAKKKKATEPEASESTVVPEASESTVEPEASESTVEPETSNMNIEPEDSTQKNKRKTRAKKKATEPEVLESTVEPEASESTIEPEASESTVEPDESEMNIEPEESTPKNKKKTPAKRRKRRKCK